MGMRFCCRNLLGKLLGPILAGIVCLGGAPSPLHAYATVTKWPQVGGPGTAVTLTYSYSNLLDGGFPTINTTIAELRAATEEALGVWAAYVPVNFVEVPDSGPVPTDTDYPATGYPDIRLGYREVTLEMAHAYSPGTTGLSGDVHFGNATVWEIFGPSEQQQGVSYLNLATHELGHSLGLSHSSTHPSMMGLTPPMTWALGTAHLYADDIAGIQTLYGVGIGSVTPLPAIPAPGAILLGTLGAGLVGRLRRCRRL